MKVGRYEIAGVLGRGSYGTVYAGQDPDGHRVAVKVFDRTGERAELITQLSCEADVLRRVENENCVRVIDVVEEPESLAIVTEFVDGSTLRDVLTEAGHLTGQQACHVMRGMLGGLAAVHRAGLVHGDVKPENVLVNRRGVSCLIDFGLARTAGS